MMKIKSRIFTVSMIGFALGRVSSIIADLKLNIYYDNYKTKFGITDVINVIFISRDLRTIDYLDEKDISLLLIPVVFLMIGMVACSTFLSYSKKYYCFIGARAGSYKELRRIVYGNPAIISLFYTFSYVLSIKGVFNEPDVIPKILGQAGTYLLVFILTAYLSFSVYERYNGGIAVIFEMIFLLVMYLIDMNTDRVHLILYDEKNYCVYNAVTLALLIAASVAAVKRFGIRRDFYVI